MMPEISLNILDVAENSVRAEAKLIEIGVVAEEAADRLTVTIKDDGCGMSEEQVAHVTDPFFTTRKTRRVGLGVPFFKLSAEQTGGSFTIDSRIGEGTCVTAVYGLSSIDRMPLGDLAGTIKQLILMHEDFDFLFTFTVNDQSFVLDTRELREILGDVSFQEPEVASYIGGYLEENIKEVQGAVSL